MRRSTFDCGAFKNVYRRRFIIKILVFVYFAFMGLWLRDKSTDWTSFFYSMHILPYVLRQQHIKLSSNSFQTLMQTKLQAWVIKPVDDLRKVNQRKYSKVILGIFRHTPPFIGFQALCKSCTWTHFLGDDQKKFSHRTARLTKFHPRPCFITIANWNKFSLIISPLIKCKHSDLSWKFSYFCKQAQQNSRLELAAPLITKISVISIIHLSALMRKKVEPIRRKIN